MGHKPTGRAPGDASTARPGRKDRRPKGAKSNDPLYGAVDLGTNNCRMLLARRTPDGFRVVEAFSRIVKLGEGLATHGSLSRAAMDRAVAALSVCAERVNKRKVTKMRWVTTEACRRASNGDVFLKRVKEATGIELEVISPEEEARLAVQGSIDLLDTDKEAALVIDIGGGSTELCWVDLAEWRARGGPDSGGRPPMRGWSTMPYGVVTMAEKFPEGEDREAWYDTMRQAARKALKPPRGARRMRHLFEEGKAHLVGTSGTVTSVAGVHLNLPRYDRGQVDGLHFTVEHARAACQRLLSKDYEGRAAEPCIGTERADLVLAGCAILEAVLDEWPSTYMRVGDRGLREGILLNLMRPKRRKRRRKGSDKGEAKEEA